MRRIATTTFVLAMSALSLPAAASGLLDGTVWEDVARSAKCPIDPLLLYSVALVESRKWGEGGLVRPSPFALRNAPRGSTFPTSKEEATELLKQFAAEDRLTDVGAMQINLRWNGHRVEKPEDLLDLRTNISVGAEILCESLRVFPHDIRLGIGGYHTMNPDRAHDAIAYGETVLYIWRKLGGRT